MRSVLAGPLRSVAVVAALVLLASACTGDGAPDATSAPTPEPTSSEEPTVTGPPDGPVMFDTTGGDVFAWTQGVSGTSTCGEVTVTVNGEEVETTNDGDAFSADVPVASGENSVVATCADGTESAPMALMGRLVARPTARVELTVADGTVVADAGSSEPSDLDGSPIASYEWSVGGTVDRNRAPLQLAGGGPLDGAKGKEVTIAVPGDDGDYFFWLTVTDEAGRTDRAGGWFRVANGVASMPDLMTDNPMWVDDAYVYAAVHAIWPGPNGAEAVEKRLDYLKALGADAIWLWPPVTTRAPGEHYAIADYFGVDPEWGNEEDIRRLVKKAHALGMRVLLDFVPNHSSIEHPYSQETVALGEQSHYYDWYDRDEQGNFTHYFDWSHLPNLNFSNPQVRAMMMESFRFWVGDVGIDGFRMDAAWGIEDRNPDFWPEWRTEMKRIKPDVFMLGEVPPEKYYFTNGFDTAFDWVDLGQWSWQGAFDAPEIANEWLNPALTNQGNGYHQDASILRFLNNNDTETRFINRYGVRTTRVASAMTFTLPGIPMIWGGDEIGANYLPYSNLTPIPWKDEHGLTPWYRDLIRLRDETPSLRSRQMEVIDGEPGSIVAYARPSFRGGPPVVVVLNYDRKTRAVLPGSPLVDQVLGGGSAVDLMTGNLVAVQRDQDGYSMPSAGHSVLVLAPGSGA